MTEIHWKLFFNKKKYNESLWLLSIRIYIIHTHPSIYSWRRWGRHTPARAPPGRLPRSCCIPSEKTWGPAVWGTDISKVVSVGGWVITLRACKSIWEGGVCVRPNVYKCVCKYVCVSMGVRAWERQYECSRVAYFNSCTRLTCVSARSTAMIAHSFVRAAWKPKPASYSSSTSANVS